MTLTGNAGTLEGQRILVLEDEYFLAQDIVRALKKAGADVVGPFPSVGDAFAAIDAGPRLDSALLDVNLRGEMVFPLANALRQRGVAFVFMTGYDRASLPIAYRDVPICEKPVQIAEFARLLSILAERHEERPAGSALEADVQERSTPL